MYYKGVLDVEKCGGSFILLLKNNQLGTNKIIDLHNDDHMAKAQVKYLMSFLSLFKEESLLLSIDDKAKVRIGISCISHHVKSKKFFKRNHGPQTTDHDFPLTNGLLIVPSGIKC